MATSANCPLCKGLSEPRFSTLPRRVGRTFHHCGTCDLVFVDASELPTPDREKARYLEHKNKLGDPKYESFFERLTRPLLEKLAPASRGLDYGCGHTPVLAEMLTRAGHAMAVYDPFFYPSDGVLWNPHDFVVCAEVAEHFHQPGREFSKLRELVRPGGWLGLMTALRKPWSHFPGWHYHRDPTHVSLYSERTLQWIAAEWGWELWQPEPGVALFRRPSA